VYVVYYSLQHPRLIGSRADRNKPRSIIIIETLRSHHDRQSGHSKLICKQLTTGPQFVVPVSMSDESSDIQLTSNLIRPRL